MMGEIRLSLRIWCLPWAIQETCRLLATGIGSHKWCSAGYAYGVVMNKRFGALLQLPIVLQSVSTGQAEGATISATKNITATVNTTGTNPIGGEHSRLTCDIAFDDCVGIFRWRNVDIS